MNSTRIKLNENWHFHEGDIEQIPLTDKNSAYQHAKTRRALGGPAAVHYNSNPDNRDTSKPHPSSVQAPMLQTTSRRRILAAALRTKKTAGEVHIIAECEHLVPASLTVSVPSTK